MNKEDILYKLSQGTYTAVWAHDEIRRQSKRIAELEAENASMARVEIQLTMALNQAVKGIAELESMLVSRTKEVDDGIKRYNKSVSKQQKIIAELEATLESVNECFGELYVKKQIEKLKEQGE